MNHVLCFLFVCFVLSSDGTVNSIQGVAKVKDPSQPAVLSVSFFKGKIQSAHCYIIYFDISHLQPHFF